MTAALPADANRPRARPGSRQLYRTMLLIRRFEERVKLLNRRGRLPGFLHLYIGEEAVATGACAALEPGDWLTSTHRGHGHVLARGADPRRMMAELFGRVDGYARGKGGSMHIADISLGILGANGIVGAGLPLATGAALAERMRGTDRVALCFFGDGASNAGVFHESLNLAAIWSLPVVFCCENNGYTELTPMSELTAGGAVAERASAYAIPGIRVDGNDVEAVLAATEDAVSRARTGGGPTLIEAVTYRLEDHNEGLEKVTGTRREPTEIAGWRERDPLLRARVSLERDLAFDESWFAAIEAEIAEILDDAVSFAESSPQPQPADAYTDGLVSETK
ncbi:MAG: thiamine pyrophosphate-dependent dehydrogenase E1 component subunit alpha [Actinomycetota bacterium]